jgi:S1-C subfamily serine protease
MGGRGVVVTNAHVIAGEDDTTVQLQGQGAKLDAQAIWFDPRNDLALLRVPALDSVRVLKLDVNSKPGISAAILGFPRNGPFDVEPARLGQTQTVQSQDAYGRGPVQRLITSFRGKVRPGNSGGPVVDSRGRVVTTVFASGVGGTQRTGFGVPDSIIKDALARANGAVGTGACAH